MLTLLQKTFILAISAVLFGTTLETDVVCPNTFPGGVWENCNNRENETCTYSCLSGFHKDPKIKNATCLPDGAWNRNTEKLCRRKCDMGIENGYIYSICTLDIGVSCSFVCNLGFKAVSNISTVTCDENGEWEPEKPCEDVLCPTTIKNGRVNEAACDRHIYSECPVICNQGYDPNPVHNKVICEIDGTWGEVDKPSCLERKGLCVNVFEHGKWTDDCHFNADETCSFECDGGFDKNPSITTNITCTSSSQWNIDLSLLCNENGRGLIVTELDGFITKHLYTVPTTLDGTPNLNYIRSLRLPTTAQFFSVDGDYMLKHAYVYDHATSAIYKGANFSIGLSGNNKWTTFHMGTSRDYVKLAVDWISHNIYWTDPQYKWIMVQSLLGNDTSLYKVLIHENLEGPHGLALDPIESLLFWSDIGTFTKIEVASLSGRNRKSLLSSNLLHPYSLTTDYLDRRLYFIDSGRTTVETVTYEGRDRKVLLKNLYSYFFDIALYKDYLYVTDPDSEMLYFFNKTNGKELHNSLYREDAGYVGITVFNPDAQPTSATAQCLNYGCKHICVTEKDGATCLCKDGYTLSQDMKTCSLSNEYFHRGLMYSNESSICIVDIRIVTAFIFTPNCVLKTNGTKYMVMDTDKRQIIFANYTAIYAASVDNPSLHRLTKQSGIISGMAWDGYDRNLYWTEENTGIIWRLSEESQTAQIFIDGLSRPRDVIVLPHERLIYWISDRNGTTIESSKTDGSNHQMVLNSADIVDPRSLSYDPYAKRIYFLDSSQSDHNSVYSCKLDGSDLSFFLLSYKILEKLEIYRGHLLVTEANANGTLLSSFSIDLRTTSTSGVFSGAGNISSIKVFDETFRQNETGPCFTLNGDCEQICIANGKSRICECTFGFKLSGNGKTCMSDPVEDNFILIIDSTHNGIYQISLTNQSIQGIISQTMSYMTGVTYNPVHDLVIWGSDESELSIMHLNGTGKKLLPVGSNSESNFVFPNRLAVDYSTGNIYFTAVDYMDFFNLSGSINVISPDGKHRVLVTGLESPHGLVVYPSKGLMFYTENGIKPYLGQASMDGSQSKVLLDLDNHWPTDLVIDYRSDYLYWIDYSDDSIKSCKLDGTEYRTLAKYPDISLIGLALYQDYLFISTEEHSHMMKLKISNPNDTTAFDVLGELGTIEEISIYTSTIQNRNAFCSSGNGGCSTFCFPTPGGSVCSCEDGVDLKKGSDEECSNKPTVTCPNKFPGGSWDNCQNREKETCTYSCFLGFHKNQKIQNATCGLDGAWNQNTEKLCRRKCGMGITNGYLNSNCTLDIGESCSFECVLGFKSVSNISTVTCHENGEWEPEEPCIDVLCPTTIQNGRVNEAACDRHIYSECPVICNQGYDLNPRHNKVICEVGGTWSEVDKPSCLERKGLCVNVFEHGKWTDNCHFNADETCAFECDGGFDKNPSITRNITCTSSSQWNIDLSLLCKENGRGLIVTELYEFNTKHLYTVPTTLDGTPNLNYIRSLRLPTTAQFFSVDGDYTLKHAYVYDHATNAIYKDANFSIGLSGDTDWTIVHMGTAKGYVKLAVDWISHNIYWTDPQYRWIMVQTLLGNDTSLYRVLIHENLEEPNGLALDPIESLLFWSDIGTFTKIEVASLSGRNRKSLISSNLFRPYSLAADYENRRLYFIDSGRRTVETVTYEGRDRKVLLKKIYSYFFDIALYKDYLYVTDPSSERLYFFNKTNGKELHNSLYREDESYLGITVFNPDAQPTSATAHCLNYGCEQICVTDKDGATCLCKDGYTLSQDMKTCSLRNEYFHRGLMYSNESSICIVDIRILTAIIFTPNCVLKTNGTKYIVIDTDKRQIIFANNTAIYAASVDSLSLHRLTKQSGIISGMAWDGYDRNLYWTEENTGIIWRLSEGSQTAKIFIEGLIRPRDVLVLPHERLIYWISDRNGTTIESSKVDGSNHQVVLNSADIVDPRSLSYDPYAKRIYFVNSSHADLNYVYSCKLDGSDLSIFLSTKRILEKLEIYRGHLLVTGKYANGTLLISYSIDHGTTSKSDLFSGAGNISSIKVFDETFRQNETGPCFTLNGDCEQICIANAKSRICECTFGFKLSGNGKTCMSDPVKDNFILIVDSTHNGIYQISLTNQNIQGIRTQTMSYLNGVTYNPVHDLVIWGSDESELTIMHLNGTGKKLLPVASHSEGYLGFTKPLAVDYSTGNIYFTTFDYLAYFNSSGSINVISPDGKHRVLITGLESPNGLVVYPSKGLMFYIENGLNPYLGQSGMDGSQSKVLLDLDDHRPTDLVIDYRSDYLYWINYKDDSIKSCKLDGTEYRTLAQYLDISLTGLALYQDYMFISTAEHSHMMKLKISNPNDTTAFDVLGELGTIEGISIYSSTIQNRNAFCASGNGGCSTFCFPTPGGRVCGCEDGVDLKKGSDKECSNMGICNATIPNGSLPIDCNLNIGSTCFYYCDDHFHKNPNISSIQCNENGEWNADLNLLCTKSTVTCPNKFPGGSWDNCQNMENEICTYSCFPGFHKSPKIQNATCGLDGAWNQNTEKLCRRKCDPKITNGFLDSSCKLEIGDVCSFECWHGYKVAPGVSTVTCQENGLWVPEEPCEAVLCPTTIPNGTVNDTVCDRRIYSECPFTCNQGFDPHPKNNKVFCNMRGKWNDLEIPYCIERKGKCVNFFKHGKWANDCHFNANETCAFECDGGFDKNPNITRNITCTSSAEWNIDLRLLCKENNRGLIVTLFPLFEESHAYTIPTHPDGTPSPNFNRSLRYPIDVQLYSVDGDYTLQQAYVYDHYTKAIYKDSNFSIGLSGENKLTTLHRGISEDYVKLAVDWISHNIYWTDPQYKWIMVQSLLGDDTLMYRVLIHDDLNGPHALALDPLEALLFWSDIGTFTKIEVSSLSGRNRKSLVYSNLLSPYGMAADHASRHLYFVDAGRETVETVTYDGKDRKVLLNKKHGYFFDIAVFKDYLYVTTKNDNLYFLNKTNGKELHKSLSQKGIMPLAVTVFHPDAQTKSVTAHCVNYGCEQICVTEIDGATCLCKDGYNLNQDKKTCSLNSEFFHRGLMYSNESSICIVDIRVVTQFVFYPNCVLKTNGTKYMILDTDDRKILFANETSIYWVRVDGPEFHRLTEPSGTISGLAWDGYDRNLYWTEHNTGIIWRLSWESRTTQVFLKGLNNPRDILILPHERLVYWISDRNGSTIESCGMDGSNLQVVLNSDDLVDPKSLSYDPQNKRIYFLSTSPEGRNYVRSCDLDGADLVYFLSPDKSLEKLEIYKGHLLVTAKDAHETLIMSYSVDNQKLTTSGIFNGTGYISAIKVFDENFRQNGTGPCFDLNGDCEQVCISNGKSRICGCTFGFKLAGSGKTCTSEPIKDNFMLARDSTHNTIYQISLTDQSVQGINAQGTDFTKGLTYNPVNSLVIWGTDESELSIMHLNGTGKKLLPISLSDRSYVSFYRFAVDYSTGNIYYTAVNNQYRVTHEGYIGVISPDRKHRVLVKGLQYPHGLVVYPSKGLLFYTDSGFSAHLGQSNMDGSQSAVLLNMHDDWPTDLTVDYKRDYLYWISYWKDSIEYCRLDGTNHDTLTKYPGTSLNGIAFYQDYLFISTVARSHIIKLNISNPNDTTAFASHAELGTIHFIGIYSSTDQNKNKLCSADNGGCSTFCFPVSGGRICGCEDGVDIKEGSQTVCSNIPYCPEIRKNIIASTDCPRLNGSKCKFTCMQGYKAKPGVDKVFCNGEIYIPEDTCEEIRCPGTLANGNWANCNFSIGTSCNYTCNYGYTRNDAVTEAECQINGNWNLASTDTLCKPITCPKQFIQGIIVSTCSGMLGQRCEYECTGYGYKKNENISIIECMESGTWSEETNSLCQQITCPKEIPNGALLRDSNGHVCSTAVGTRCGFECDTGFVKARNVDSLHCLLDGWAEDLQTLCIAITCPKQFNQGRIASTCAGMHGQQCDYECTGYGYKKNENIATIECMDSGTWSRDTDSLCQQITCPKEIPNGALVKGSDGLVCSTAVGTRCDFECNSGYFKDPSVQSLYCLLDGWVQDLHTLCTVPPAVSSGHHSDVNPAAIGAGVAIGVSIIIVIILVILRRKRLFSKFVLKRKDDELISGPDMQMSTSFGPEEDRQYDHVEYDSYLVNTSSPTKQEPTEVSLPTKYNIMGNSTKYDSDMAIPRPRAKENPLNKTP